MSEQSVLIVIISSFHSYRLQKAFAIYYQKNSVHSSQAETSRVTPEKEANRKNLKILYILMRKSFVLIQRWSRENSFLEMLFQPRAVAESPFLVGFKSSVDVALGDMDGFDDLRSFSNLNNSIIFKYNNKYKKKSKILLCHFLVLPNNPLDLIQTPTLPGHFCILPWISVENCPKKGTKKEFWSTFLFLATKGLKSSSPIHKFL